MPSETAFPVCSECGWVHPPTPTGACSAGAAKRLEESKKDSKGALITPVLSKLMDHLKASNDWIKEVNTIESALNIKLL